MLHGGKEIVTCRPSVVDPRESGEGGGEEEGIHTRV